MGVMNSPSVTTNFDKDTSRFVRNPAFLRYNRRGFLDDLARIDAVPAPDMRFLASERHGREFSLRMLETVVSLSVVGAFHGAY